MEIKTTTTTVFTIALTDADVGEILADPSAFQRELRAIRNGKAKARAKRLGRKEIKLGPKAPARKPRPAKERCPKCGRIFAHHKRLLNHLQKEHSELQPTVRAAA